MHALAHLRELCAQAEGSSILALTKFALRLGYLRLQIVSLKHVRRQEAIAFLLDHGITLATQLFQLWPVQYRDLPTDVADNTELVQFTGGFGDPFSAHAEHVGDELLGHDQLVG